VDDARGPESRALDATRSWVILTVISLSWTLTFIVTFPRWEQLSTFERACILVALALFATAIVLARRRWTLWCAVMGMVLLASTALVPSGSLVWTYPQIYLGYVGFLLSMLLPSRTGLVTATAIPFIAWAVLATSPPNVVPEGFSVAGGVVLVLRMLTAQWLLWWAWNRLRDVAAAVDAQRWDLRQQILRATASQEESRHWRETASRVHATMLNSVSAVLESDDVDPTRVRVLAAQGRAAIERLPNPPLPRFAPSTLRLPVNAGSVIISSALAGALIGGSLYIFFIPYPSSWLAALAVMTSTVGCALAVIVVVRWQRVPQQVASVLVLIPAAVPWVFSLWPHPCGDIGPVSAAASLAGFAIVCLGLWSGPTPFILGLVTWLLGALRITQVTPAECTTAPTVIILNVATFLPVVAVIVLVGSRKHRASIEAIEELNMQAEAEGVRARAQARVDEEFSHLVHRSADVLDSVSRAGQVSTEDRSELMGLASRMRAAVTIDIASAGGFSRSLYEIVMRLTERGVPVDVGAASDSGDPSMIPDAWVDRVLNRVTGCADGTARIQCMGSTGWDFLSVSFQAREAASVAEESLEESTYAQTTTWNVVINDEPESNRRVIVTIERSTLGRGD